MRSKLRLLLSGSPRAREEQRSYGSRDVAAYYETFTDTYLSATGEFIQAFRSADTDALMQYLVASMGLADGMNLLDAGCGVGAPAFWIAEHFPNVTVTAVTNSERQYRIASEKLKGSRFEERIRFVLGDYHELSSLCPTAVFDRVMFIESLGHSDNPALALGGAASALRPGGQLYIKDFFRRATGNPDEQGTIDNAVRLINDCYCYNVLSLPSLIEAIALSGLSLDFARRPQIDADFKVTQKFEDESGRLTYPVLATVWAVDWYELLAVRH